MNQKILAVCSLQTIFSLFCIPNLSAQDVTQTAQAQPNIIFILTDDHRWDSLGAANEQLTTPNIDSISQRGTQFANAFVTLAICSPSRAACLTGRYGSLNGVTSVGNVGLAEGEQTFANSLRDAGYATGVTGKWHLKTTPQECGFDFASTCWANGTWYDRTFSINGSSKVMPGFVDDVTAQESIRFIDESVQSNSPFALWMCTQVPHMDHRHTWPAKPRFLSRRRVEDMPLPITWNDDLAAKPDYLKSSRSRTRALEYGYDRPNSIRAHTKEYRASVEQMDLAIGSVLDAIEQRDLSDNTWVIFMGDNGWFLGEHGFTSKVLPYEESMRVPMSICGPGTKQQSLSNLVLNIDLTATIYDLAGLPIPSSIQGKSLVPLLHGNPVANWRESFIYEAPTAQLGSQPLWAVRSERWKYIETQQKDGRIFAELYDLDSDSNELHNVAGNPANQSILERFSAELEKHKRLVRRSLASNRSQLPEQKSKRIPASPPGTPRTDVFISGVYPHLTTYGVYSQNGAHFKEGHNECGIGAVVPWAGKLWMVNYAPHKPKGSEHKLFSIDEDLTKPMTVHPQSVGGTPAGRMIHAESQQLLIGHHLIDSSGNVRTIQPADMPIRVTAIARHLEDPTNMVYYIDMEGSIWEANVHSLKAKRLFKKPVPGWHGKGGYTSQGRLVIANNGELHVGNYDSVLVGGKAQSPEERGVLAEWDGQDWRIIERRQFTEVTGPKGITGGSEGDDPIWSIGWDRRSVRLKVLENGSWLTFLLPKASYCNDASHGWYTEWPRIREITGGRWMMDMHGMFFDFPKSFSSKNSAGILPIGSHLRYVPDFCNWNGKLVLASDETSIQGNPLAGQPQSNLWFGSYEELKQWGPANGYGGPWLDDKVAKNTWSDPFLVAGFKHRTIHLAVGPTKPTGTKLLRCTDQQLIKSIPDRLALLPRVTIERGDWHQPASGFSFRVNHPVTVFLAVDKRGSPQLDERWQLTDMNLLWGKNHHDRVYQREFPAGSVQIPANNTQHSSQAFGLPHTAFVQCSRENLDIAADKWATVTVPAPEASHIANNDVIFKIQIDGEGTGQWVDYDQQVLAYGESKAVQLPTDLQAVWVRFSLDHDSVATAFLHQTSDYPVDISGEEKNSKLFQSIAGLDDASVSSLIYPAKRNRNLRIIASSGEQFEFGKNDFKYSRSKRSSELEKILEVDREFLIDDASVIVVYQGQRYRLPKGDSAYDKPFAFGWPRAVREVESERHLANIHGTFYELPLVTNGSPPAWNLIRPVASHRKQIADFCSWNGLLVLSGVKPEVIEDPHVFRDTVLDTGLWFGGVDDLWKLGKPIGNGGPWLNTEVQANLPSDPYLMRGYDRKKATLSHEADESVSVRLEIDIDGNGRWVKYADLKVAAGEELEHEFPAGFSACWIRAVADTSTTASFQLEYR